MEQRMAAPAGSRRSNQHAASLTATAAAHAGEADPDALKQHIYGQLKRSGVVSSLKVSQLLPCAC